VSADYSVQVRIRQGKGRETVGCRSVNVLPRTTLPSFLVGRRAPNARLMECGGPAGRICSRGHEPERILSPQRIERPEVKREGTISEIGRLCQEVGVTVSTRSGRILEKRYARHASSRRHRTLRRGLLRVTDVYPRLDAAAAAGVRYSDGAITDAEFRGPSHLRTPVGHAWRLHVLWHRLLARSVSESGRLRHDDGTHGAGTRRQRVLVLTTVSLLSSAVLA
jgi:hypothetical protein